MNNIKPIRSFGKYPYDGKFCHEKPVRQLEQDHSDAIEIMQKLVDMINPLTKTTEGANHWTRAIAFLQEKNGKLNLKELRNDNR